MYTRTHAHTHTHGATDQRLGQYATILLYNRFLQPGLILAILPADHLDRAIVDSALRKDIYVTLAKDATRYHCAYNLLSDRQAYHEFDEFLHSSRER